MRKMNKLLAILLAVAMTFNTVPVSIRAEAEDDMTEESVIESVYADETANDLSEAETDVQTSPVEVKNDSSSSGTSNPDVNDGQSEENKADYSMDDDIGMISEEDQSEEFFVMLTSVDEFNEEYTVNEDGTIAAATLRTAEDFVRLSNRDAAVYQNASITIARDASLDLSGTAFRGLGSETYPFAGSMTISAGSTSTTPITLSKSLFNGLSQKAIIDSNLYLEAADNMTEPLLAAAYLKGDATNEGEISITVSSKSTTDADNDTTYSSFGGLIGNMGSGTKLSLSVINNIQEGNAVLSNTKNLGFFCNTMAQNAELTIASYTGATNYTITTTNGYAGGLVGYMEDNAALTVGPIFDLTGNITGTTGAGGAVGGTGSGASLSLHESFTYSSGTIRATGGNAGGFIGEATDSSISLVSDKKITVGGTISAAASSSGSGYSAGGFVGNYTYTGDVKSANQKLDLALVNINNATLSSGNHIGGLFGLFTNQSDFAITDLGSSKTIVTTTNTANSNTWQYGGLIGQYIPGELSDSLTIQNIKSFATQNGTVTSFGGLIALVNKESAYIKISDVTVETSGRQPSGTNGVFGGIISEGNDKSHFFDIGTVTVQGNYSATIAGALIGTIQEGVVKLSGTTDFSSAKCNIASMSKGQLIGKRQNAFVYATGSGEDANTWILNRSKAVAVSDLGDWGEVVRITSENGLTGLVTEDCTNHTVTINADESPYELSAPLEYAQLALAIQLNTASLPTNGALRFANGAPASSTALEAEINLKSDISMSGTGISELTRDDASQTFIGKLHGNSHKLSIYIGQPYGMRNDASISEEYPDEQKYGDERQKMYANGSGQIYSHSHLGIFSKVENISIDNLIVNGNIYCGQGCVGLYAGAIAGSISGNSTLTDIDSDIIIKMPDGTETTHIGGYFGMAEQESTISFTRCDWLRTSKIYSQFSQSNDYIGGFLGAYGTGSGLNFDNCNIAGTIIRAGYTGDYAYVGGLVAMGSGDSTINITGCTVSPTIKVMCKKDCGGLLGFDWPNTDVTITGMHVTDATLNTNSDNSSDSAYFGGLVYEASGTWTIKKNVDSSVTHYGIEFRGRNYFTGKSDDTITSGLLVCRGDDYKENNSALCVFIGKDAYQIGGTVNFAGPVANADYFDEIVGNTISSVTNQNGVVSIATTNHALIDQDGVCNTYKKQLSSDYNNRNTRYYYNLDNYEKSEGDIISANELLMWSVGVYAADNIYNNFITGGKSDAVTIKGTNLNLSGYSYYPVTPEGTVTIDNADITFSAETYETVEGNTDPVNKKPSDQYRQHYMMHAGLFLDVSHDVAVNKLTLDGTILQGENGSGALVCGTVSGSSSSTTTLKLNTIQLNGIEVYGYETKDGSGYAPLLINKVSSYSAINMDGVTQVYSMSDANKIAASSLIGNVGSETACGINLSFLNMELDAITATAVLSNATFMESFQYDINAAASSGGQYTFNSNDKYTVGQELSNTEGGSVSGRNNGQQYYYYDMDKYVGNATEETKATYYATGYLRYVHIQEDTSAKKYEIDINQRVLHLLKGCGTYGDPFEIEFAGQFSALAKCLDGNTSSGWVVQLNPSTLSSQSMTTTHTSDTANNDVDHKYYIFSGNQWYVAKDNETGGFTASSETADSANVITYLRNAYYVITEDMTIGGGSYNGLGNYNSGISAVTTGGAFSGVIIGKKADGSYPTVTIASPKENGAAVQTMRFGGLVKYGNGCVIKDINVRYTDTDGHVVTISSTGAPVSQKPEDQVFFGGVIGYAMGGDNIIDNVSVSYEENSAKVDGDKSYLANVGGYVGLVGGSVSAGTGGGVIFRNLTGNTVAFSVNSVDTTGDNNYYYWNPFVGRVLDGFACYDSANSINDKKSSEAVYLQNTDKNYTIPNLVTDTSFSLGQSFTIMNAQQAWLLSAIVNSGAGSKKHINDSTCRYSTDDTAYYYGKTRSGSYTRVGTSNTPEDESFWGGNGYENNEAKNKYAYLLTKFVSNYKENEYSKKLAGTNFNSNYNVTINTDLHLESYLTSFRGIGAGYYSNRDNTSGVRQTFLISLTGNPSTINMNVSLDEYSDDAWHLCQLGYYNAIRYNADISISNITVSGTLSLAYHKKAIEASTSGTIANPPGGDVWLYMGGLIASTALPSDDKKPTIKSVKAENLTIYGGSFVGGIVGGTVTTSTGDKQKFNSIDLTDCSYSGLTLHATNAAGGFIGNIYDSGTMSITGNTNGDSESKIYSDFYGINYDNRGAHDNIKTKYMWGVGGLVGYSRNTSVTINEDFGQLKLQGITLQGHNISYAADFGVGGLIGTLSGDNDQTVKNITMNQVSVKGYDGTSISNIHLIPYAVPLTGGLYGYCRSWISASDVTIEQCKILYGGLSGGIAGLTNKGFTISGVKIDDSLLYTQEAYTYQGYPQVGGIVGYMAGGTPDIKNTIIQNTTIAADGTVGGLIGTNNAGNTCNIYNVSFKNNKIVSNSWNMRKCWNKENQDPNKASKLQELTVAVGGFVGYTKLNISAYNIYMEDNLIGFALAGNSIDTDLTLEKVQKLSKSNVGLSSNDASTCKSYSDLFSNVSENLTGDSSYVAGNIGTLVGRLDDSKIVNVVALCVKAAYSPNQLIGTKQNSNIPAANRIVFADYKAYSASSSSNKKDSNSPFVDINPLGSISVKNNENSDAITLTGDGVAMDDSKNTIISSIISESSTYSPLTYSRIASLASTYTDDISDSAIWSTYRTEEASSSYWTEDISAPTADFPVLVVTTNSPSALTSVIKKTLSVLTNTDQTSTVRCDKITSTTYEYNGNAWIKKNDNYTIDVSGERYKIPSGRYNNELGQITILDAQYNVGSYKYHLYIPVLVKKVMQVEFSLRMLTGTNYYEDAYNSTDAVLASIGEAFTSMATYQYSWSAGAWNSYISGGASLLWNFDKQLKLDATSAGSLKADTTRITLVDANRHGSGNTWFTANGSVISDDATLLFKNIESFKPVPLCDLLNLNVSGPSADGDLVLIGEYDATDAYPADATIRVWNSEKGKFAYYRAKTGSDQEGNYYYTIKVKDSSGSIAADDNDVSVKEVYYLTMNCTGGTDIVNRSMSLGRTRLDGGQLPTQTTLRETRIYTVGNFYSLGALTLDTVPELDSGDIYKMAIGSNEYIDVKVTAPVTVSSEHEKDFANFIGNKTTYLRIAVQLANNGTAVMIDPGSNIIVNSLKVGDTDIAVADYSASIVNGVYYITIAQQGSAFINKTVSADLRFSYKGDAGLLASQFPERTSQSDTPSGVNFVSEVSIAYSETSLDNSRMSGTITNSSVYYREAVQVADITYNSYNTTSIDGNTSQLGINGKEVSDAGGTTIRTQGMYDATQISGLNTTSSTNSRYPYYLVGTLTLQKKTGDVKAPQYQTVKMSDYMSNIVVTSGDTSATVTESGGAYTFKLPLTETQVRHLDMRQVEVDIQYFVKSDTAIEALGNVGQYANYKVILSAHLANMSGRALVSDVDDYIIYTNAKFYHGIIGAGDFGRNE